MRVAVELAARPREVWAELSDLSSHADWMDDAVRITMTSAQRQGVGTTFDCLTRIGPIRLHDHMRVVEWVEGRRIGIQHEGLIKGKGRFSVERKGRRGTRLVWRERLRPPWWLGGRISGVPAGWIMRRVAKRDLANLRRRFEA